MRYLFFDCECANCYNHEGKICSFGYVLTDESFKTLEEKDLIINPDAPFDPHVLGVGSNSIDLAYTPIRFQHAPKFDAVFPQISNLLGDPDIMVFGYAVENDVGFLFSECRRYHLTLPRFTYFDIQDIYRLYREWDRSPSLEDALKDLEVPFDDYAEHQSSDDAKMSMLLLKKIVNQTGYTLPNLLLAFPTCKDTTGLFALQEQIVKPSTRDLGLPYDSEFRDSMRTFYEFIGYSDPEAPSHRLEGRRFLFSSLTRQDVKTLLFNANQIADRSGLIVRYLKEATDYVVYDEQEKTEVAPLFEPTGISILTLSDLSHLFESL
jgi:DNA polymerase III epsilon subunit-like protein